MKITDFKGEIPKRNRRLLPSGFATVASNVRLEDGILRPFRKPLTVHTLADSAVSFYRHGDDWLSWNVTVNAAQGPVAQDRLYYTGANFQPKMRVGNTQYNLALPSPASKLTITAQNEQVFPTVNDPDDFVDLDAFEPPPAITDGPAAGAGNPSQLHVHQAPEFEPPYDFMDEDTNTAFADRLGIPRGTIRQNTTPAIIHVLDQNGDIVTTDNTTRVTMSVSSGNGYVRGNTSGTAVNGVVTLDDLYLLAAWLETIFFRYSASGLKTDISSTETVEGDTAVLPPSQKGIPFALGIARQPEGGVDNESLVTLPVVVVLDALGNICTGLDGFEVTMTIAEGNNAAIRGKRTAKTAEGVARWSLDDEIRVTGTTEDDIIFEFFGKDVAPVLSDPIRLEANRTLVTQTVLYTYTFVTEFDEESAPAPVSDFFEWYSGLVARLTDFFSPPSGRGVNRIRIYRSLTSFSGITDFYFVSEIAIATQTYDHDIDESPLAEILPSNDYDPPPASMHGLTSMPNGMMAAFSGREVLFSEPYRPHAWPVKYRLTVEHDIVGVVSFGSALAILTNSTPYVAQGTSPETMVMEKLEQNLPCVSARSIVDLGYSAAYATHEGLVLIGIGQQGNVITRQMFTRDQWQSFVPSTIDAENYMGRYVFSYIPEGGIRTMGMIDLTGDMPFFVKIDLATRTFHYEPESGKLFILTGTDEETFGRLIAEFDAPDQEPMDMIWRSGVMKLPGYVSFGAILAQSEDNNHNHETSVAIRVIADGSVAREITTLDTPERLPSGFMSDEWEIEVEGTSALSHIYMGRSIEEIGGMM